MEREKEKKKRKFKKRATWKISFMPVRSRGPCAVMWYIKCALCDYIIILVHKLRRIGYNAGWSTCGLWLVRFCHLPSPAAGELRLFFFFFSISVLYSLFSCSLVLQLILERPQELVLSLLFYWFFVVVVLIDRYRVLASFFWNFWSAKSIQCIMSQKSGMV